MESKDHRAIGIAAAVLREAARLQDLGMMATAEALAPFVRAAMNAPTPSMTAVERGDLGDGSLQNRLFHMRAFLWWLGAPGNTLNTITDAQLEIERLGGGKRVLGMEIGGGAE